MNRRDSLKVLGIGTISTSVLLDACKPKVKPPPVAADTGPVPTITSEGVDARLPQEIARDKKLNADTFFTKHEMATITLLADIIIPKDAVSGSASDAKVPEFIEFIAKDMPEHQVPLRGGLRWLDLQCLNRYNNTFAESSDPQQLEMVTAIAYPLKAKPEMAQGVAFFNRMRDLTATGFYTTEIGFKDIGYLGNAPNQWTGVPPDVLKQYGMENV